VQSAERVRDQSVQLFCRAVDGLTQGRGLVSDRNGMSAFEACFNYAALVVLAALVDAVLAQVDLHSSNAIVDSAHGILHYTAYMSGQCLVTFDVVVGIDLYLHGVLLLGLA
jgi:hypothetical protein